MIIVEKSQMNLIDVKNLLFKYKMYSGEKEEVIEHTAIDNISLSIKKEILWEFSGIMVLENLRLRSSLQHY